MDPQASWESVKRKAENNEGHPLPRTPPPQQQIRSKTASNTQDGGKGRRHRAQGTCRVLATEEKEWHMETDAGGWPVSIKQKKMEMALTF